MVIVTKNVKSIEEVNAIFENTCPPVWNTMKPILESQDFSSYEDWVDWALNTMKNNPPSPTSFTFPNTYTLSLMSAYFTISIPNQFGFGIAIDNAGTKNEVYRVDILLYKPPKFVEQSSYYQELLDNGWTRKLKEDKKTPPKKQNQDQE